MSDMYDLQRFVNAQDPAYARVIAELSAGRKTSHWMWYVFPQIAGLGSSPMAQKFAISSLDEASAYLAHDVLGTRLKECTRLVLAVKGRPIGEILGYPDDLKFRSSMTLFAQASTTSSLFHEALTQYFDGKADVRTLELLANSARN
jgi:uncharacterized protein (DUF1810 family)